MTLNTPPKKISTICGVLSHFTLFCSNVTFFGSWRCFIAKSVLSQFTRFAKKHNFIRSRGSNLWVRMSPGNMVFMVTLVIVVIVVMMMMMMVMIIMMMIMTMQGKRMRATTQFCYCPTSVSCRPEFSYHRIDWWYYHYTCAIAILVLSLYLWYCNTGPITILLQLQYYCNAIYNA